MPAGYRRPQATRAKRTAGSRRSGRSWSTSQHGQERRRGGIEPLCVSTPHELKSCPSTSPTHPGSRVCGEFLKRLASSILQAHRTQLDRPHNYLGPCFSEPEWEDCVGSPYQDIFALAEKGNQDILHSNRGCVDLSKESISETYDTSFDISAFWAVLSADSSCKHPRCHSNMLIVAV